MFIFGEIGNYLQIHNSILLNWGEQKHNLWKLPLFVEIKTTKDPLQI